MTYTKYTTKQGDRWDTVSSLAYGDGTKISELMQANPKVPKDVLLPAGITLYVPILSQPEVETNLLPPWKR